MKRISTSTADVDKFGTGRNGFTNGDPDTAVPPTQLDEADFDHYQEETARAVEGAGATLDEDNYNQLDDAIQEAAVRGVSVLATHDYVLSGLTLTLNGASLVIPLAAGAYVMDGRRYVVTAAKLLAATANSFTLTASRDTYFYIAPENPGTPSTPPNRETVYVTTVAVTNGAAAPSTPAGTLLFAMVVSNGSGSTSVTYYSRGPRLADENGTAIHLRPQLGVTTRATLMPASASVDLGTDIPDSSLGHFHTAHFQRVNLKTTASSLHTSFRDETYTILGATTAGGTAEIAISEVTTALPSGSVAQVHVVALGSNPTDPTDNYSARLSCHFQQDGGTPSLEGSAGAVESEWGSTAIADGVGIGFHISGGTDLNLTLTGHSTDAMRWALHVHVFITGN